MNKKNKSLLEIVQLIANILSFDSSYEELKKTVSTEQVDWDAVVSVGSQHLVLPAIYCRLKDKSLLEYLPNDLVNYLKELTDLNRDRNTILITEAQNISILFNKHNIEHVFLKGVALIGGKYFHDIAERMVGDIDILIAKNQIDEAYALLTKYGYSNSISFNYEVKNYRHYPRQISDNHLGAIELHEQVLNDGHRYLIDLESVFLNKKIVNNLPIPNENDLILNTLYTHQINDKNYFLGNLKLKNAYDTLVLKLGEKQDMLNMLSKNKYSRRFLVFMSVFFPSIAYTKLDFKDQIALKLFAIKLKIPFIGNTILKLKFIILNLTERISLLIKNGSYRRHIFKKLFLKELR